MARAILRASSRACVTTTSVTPSSRFSSLLQTSYRRSYALESRDSLGATNWSSLPAVTGNGALRLLTDPAATAPQRFYRIRQW